MIIKKEEKINIEGKQDFLLLKSLNKIINVGGDQVIKTCNQDNFTVENIGKNIESFFQCFQLNDQEVLLVSDKKLVKVSCTDIDQTEQLKVFDEQILSVVLTKELVCILFDNKVQILDKEYKEKIILQKPNLQNMKCFKDNVYLQQNNCLLKIVLNQDNQQYYFEQILEQEQGFQDYLILEDNIFFYQNKTIFKKNQNEIEEIIQLDTEHELNQMFLLDNKKILCSFNQSIIIVDFVKKIELASSKDIQKLLKVYQFENNIIALSFTGDIFQLELQTVFEQKRKRIDLEQSDIEEEQEQKKDLIEQEEPQEQSEEQNLEQSNLKEENNDDIIQDNQQIIQNNNQQQKQNNDQIHNFIQVYPQNCFIPGSYYNDKIQKTLLKKNIFGQIILYEDNQKPEIEIEFADHNLSEKLILKNDKNFTLGDINQSAFALASQQKETQEDQYQDELDEEEQISILYFKEIQRQNSWEIFFDSDFCIDQIVISNMLIYVLSTEQELKVYNYGGIEIFNRSLNGQIICITAFQHLFAYAYQTSLPIYGRQNINVEIFDLYTFQIKSNYQLSLTPYSYLTWFGYSDDGILYCQDEKGKIRMSVNDQYWVIVYKPIEERIFWLYGIMDKELIGYRLSLDESEINLNKNYNVFRIIPKCSVYTTDETPTREQQDIIYQVADKINESQKYENFKHLKHTITHDFQLKSLQQKILSYDEQQDNQNQIEYKKLELARQLLTQGKEYAAVYQMLQIRQEDYFQTGIELFEELKHNKLAKELKKIAQERGIMMNFEKQIIVPQIQTLRQSNEREEKMQKYLQENNNQNIQQKSLLSLGKNQLKNDNNKNIKNNQQAAQQKNNVQIQQKKINKDLLGALGNMKKNNKIL